MFEEDKSWDWDKKYEETIGCNLERGDRKENVVIFYDNEEGSEFDLDANVEDEEENLSSDSLDESSLSLNEGRNMNHQFGLETMKQEKDSLKKTMKLNWPCLQLLILFALKML